MSCIKRAENVGDLKMISFSDGGVLGLLTHLSQEAAGLNGHRSQFQFAVQNVADGVDVRYVGLLLLVGDHFAVPVHCELMDKKCYLYLQ